jgi:predicted GNAT family acetyltransferase
MNNLRTYRNAQNFLNDIQPALETHEAANSLMLGICGQLIHHPERFQLAPCLKTVVDESGLILAALMTPPHKLIVYHHQGDLESAARLLVEELAREGWQVPGVFGPGEAPWRVAQRWAETTGKSYHPGTRQGVYELREVLLPPPERGSLRPAMQAELELVTGWWMAFYREIFGGIDPEEARHSAQFRIGAGDCFLWIDEQPVSMAMKTRPTRHGISVSLVYTPPELRHRGYATACVAGLSRLLLASGWRHCALFTDLSNPTSNHIYQEIGYRWVCGYEEYVFQGSDETTQ